MSDLGNLSQCMVDNDPESRARARRLRRKALLASVFIEGLCLGVMLLWPLITPGVLPNGYIVTPLPPYQGGGSSAPRTHTRLHPRTDRKTTLQRNVLTYHPTAPQRHTQVDEQSAPQISESASFGIASGSEGADGPSVPWAPAGGRSGVVVPPPTPPVRTVRQKISEGVMESALIRRVEPIYPLIARNIHLSGTVRLRALIATDGSVQNLEVLSGSAILARAAEAAVRQWRYRPTLLNGVPVEVETYITVNFELGTQ